MTTFRDDTIDVNNVSVMASEDVTLKDSKPAGLIQSVDRAMQIMQLLSDCGTQTVTEISQKLEVQHGMVEQYQNRGAYRLGLALVGFTNSVLKDYNILDYTRPVCEKLGRETDETVNVAIIVGKNVINIDQVTGSGAIASVNWIGKHTPIHATSSGKSIIAHMPVEKREKFIQTDLQRFTEHTLVDPEKFRDALKVVRKQGFAITIHEFELGLTGIAAPIFDSVGSVEASISVSAPTFRAEGNIAYDIAAKVKEAADEVSRRIGYRTSNSY